jgi:hypothetical protein
MNLVMYKRFILLLGVLLGSHLPVAGQTPVPQIVLARERGAQIVTMSRPLSIPLLNPSFLLSQDLGQSPAPFSLMFRGAYQRGLSLEHFSPMERVKTLTLTQSSLPLFQLWGGRLQLGAFQSTLHSQNVPLGPLGSGDIEGFRPTRQTYPGGPLSIHFSGFSLSFHFRRDSRTGQPTQAWRRMTRFVGTLLN